MFIYRAHCTSTYTIALGKSSKPVRSNSCIAQNVCERVPGCWTHKGEGTRTKGAATDTWNWLLMATSETGTQQSVRRLGAWFRRQRWTLTASLSCTRCVTSGQCRSSWSSCDRRRSYLPFSENGSGALQRSPVLRWSIQQWVQITRYRRSVMMISNDRRMPSSADLHGKTELTARGEQPVGGNSNQ